MRHGPVEFSDSPEVSVQFKFGWDVLESDFFFSRSLSLELALALPWRDGAWCWCQPGSLPCHPQGHLCLEFLPHLQARRLGSHTGRRSWAMGPAGPASLLIPRLGRPRLGRRRAGLLPGAFLLRLTETATCLSLPSFGGRPICVPVVQSSSACLAPHSFTAVAPHTSQTSGGQCSQV